MRDEEDQECDTVVSQKEKPPHTAAVIGVTEHKKGGMGQLSATAICGNDITSSCLYVSALAIISAGRWAPIVLLMVAGVLYLFRSIYAEVVGALPLNGGAYNALLNTTSKFRASIAARLTILSYMATAVMALFGLGNLFLKARRAGLARPTIAPLPSVLVAVAAVILGLVGNAVMNPTYLAVFMEYFAPALLIVSIMLGRITTLEGCLFLVRAVLSFFSLRMTSLSGFILGKIEEINSQQMVFFARGDNLANLNRAILYVRENEHTNRIKVVTAVRSKAEVSPRLETDLKFLNEAYPGVDIEFVVLEGIFGPELIQEVPQKWGIPSNLMFIGSPGNHFMHGLADLGGVPLII